MSQAETLRGASSTLGFVPQPCRFDALQQERVTGLTA